MMRLLGKRAVVTGGANGIGRATAALFAREGAHVAIADRDLAAGESTFHSIREAGGRAEFFATDMTNEPEVSSLFVQAHEILGGLDILVSNAGGSITEDLLETVPEAWQQDIQLNLSSHYFATRHALPLMIAGGGGSIVTVASVNALWSIGEFGYSAAKAGLISLTRNIAVTYGSKGVRANVICPGTVESEAGGDYWDRKVGGRERLLAWYPLGRLGRPEDVASMALYLASDESSFVTGATMVIDGGLTAGSRLFGRV
jgi:NAD(P)-dependent dehydrogenase (short-subunit alcohol dehydrogenase family)